MNEVDRRIKTCAECGKMNNDDSAKLRYKRTKLDMQSDAIWLVIILQTLLSTNRIRCADLNIFTHECADLNAHVPILIFF